MRFKIGDEVVVRKGSILTFKNDHTYNYGGAKGSVIGFNAGNDGYIVRFSARTIASFDADHVTFVKDNYTYEDRVIFYDKHLDIYVKSWIDNLKSSWCV